MARKKNESISPGAENAVEDELVFPGEESFSDLMADEEDAGDGLEPDDRQSTEIREIFGTAFPQYLQPVEEIVEQLLSGNGDPESLEALAGMLTSLKEASSRMGFDNVGKLLTQLEESISMVGTENGQEVPSDIREAILGDLLDLKDLAAEMGGQVPGEPRERQRTIIEALRDKEGVGKLVLKRMSAAGLVTVDQLLMARPEEIAAVAGLELEVVHTILGHLSDDDSGGGRDTKQGRGGAESPEEVESLHEQILEKLRDEAEVVAGLEELKAEIRELRFKVMEHRADLQSLDTSLDQKKKAWGAFTDQMADQAYLLDELRAKRDALSRAYVSSEETVHQKEVRLETLRREQRSLEEETISLNRAVGTLIDKVGRVRRSVAKRRLVQ